MANETSILSACVASREAFDRVVPYLGVSDFSPLAGFWWPLVIHYYKLADKSVLSADRSILRARGGREASEKHRETHLGFFDGLPTDVDGANGVQEVLDLKRVATGNELAGLLTAPTSKHKQIQRAMDSYASLLTATDLSRSEIIYAGDVTEVIASMDGGERLPLYPKSLNDKVSGGIYPGSWILIFGQPEIGKSLFSIHLIAQWLKLGKKILLCVNEERVTQYKFRIMQNLANMTKEESEQFPEEFQARGVKHGVDERLIAAHLMPGSIPEIEQLVKLHDPDILVVDQLRNVGASGDGSTARLNNVAMEFRSLISRYNLYGVGMAQAAPSERGKKEAIWLTYDSVEGSRTGLPSQSDVQIGIGGDVEMKKHNTRAVSFCRNKVSGDHSGIVVKIDPMRMRVGPWWGAQ